MILEEGLLSGQLLGDERDKRKEAKGLVTMRDSR